MTEYLHVMFSSVLVIVFFINLLFSDLVAI